MWCVHKNLIDWEEFIRLWPWLSSTKRQLMREKKTKCGKLLFRIIRENYIFGRMKILNRGEGKKVISIIKWNYIRIPDWFFSLFFYQTWSLHIHSNHIKQVSVDGTFTYLCCFAFMLSIIFLLWWNKIVVRTKGRRESEHFNHFEVEYASWESNEQWVTQTKALTK